MWVASVHYNYQHLLAYGRTKTEATSKLWELQSRKGDVSTVKLKGCNTIAAFLQQWLTDVVEVNWRPTTAYSYRKMLKKHVHPVLGTRGLAKVKPAEIESLLANMQRSGRSSSVGRKVYNILHVAFAKADRWGIIRQNPASLIDRPPGAGPRMAVLSTEQVGALLKAGAEDGIHALLLLAVSTGMRQGEIFGLRWEDVKLPAGVIEISKTLSTKDRSLAPTKTEGSRRLIHLSVATIAALRAHQKAQRTGEAVSSAAHFVFCNTIGRPIQNNNFMKRIFKPLLVRAKLPNIRFHDLRHTAATLLLSNGTNIKIIQQMLGHTSAKTTLDVYAHTTPTMQKQAADDMDAILGLS
jgi:integrase